MGVKLPTDLATLLRQLRAEGVSEFEAEGDTVRVRFGDPPVAAKAEEKKTAPRKLAAVTALKGFPINPDQFE